ncbi:MAG: type II secretion system GspH family protein [Candidatus Pacebacteria bacterium]|nr:type II secretion system GspH family protein [Candidatus Paceibacterota bacterium]
MKSKGFTLIELLVVIAIIGILASVVMGSLNTARNNAADAAIKSNLTGVRSAASIWYDDNGFVYASTDFTLGTCPTSATTGNIFADAKILSAITGAITQSGFSAAAGSQCVALADAWAVAVQLKTGGTAGDTIPDAWCVDSVGASRAYTYAALGPETIVDAINGDTCNN